ncbi:ImmA/IrrE family metallo-endopeptidase [Cytophagaceae bacterium 50C-KIRBA]|uniref:ImmA/IrrE family metallo-endopeptidase n=1 Tax=Aquirufa beregesia TaxID=2516556 RepID=A0ABX0EW80_9BACT|nr:ImmA/IrrE family metallo-endopeptidase [Aquirufa beregesia]NGZ43687.1 ImmA/IrrE family metallo-endopeptidase [Aquirufa beregesia]
MATALEIAKSLLSPPGDTIQEHIDFMGMSQAELAERMGRPKEKINDVIKGREPISTATAFQLEKVLDIPASFWLNREKTYRQELYELQQREELEKEKDWLDAFPIHEMRKLGWLPNTKEKHILVDKLLKFFSVASADEWKRIYVDEQVSVAFKISLAHTQSPHAISAWLRQGELQAKEIKIAEFDKKKFKDALTEMRELAFLMPENFTQSLQNMCASCGVALVFTQNLPKAPISGATRWFHNKPIIQIAGRFKTDDHFWFTFFHEAAHIILHGKKDIFLENVEGTEIDQEKEQEANTFAAKLLLPEHAWQQILDAAPLSEEMIQAFAHKFRTPAGVIKGRLQQIGLLPFHVGNGLRQKIVLFN